MFKKLQSYLKQPFLVWEYTARRKWIVLVSALLFSVLFKLIYQPFGINSTLGVIFFMRRASITATVILFQFFFLPRLRGGYFREEKRTIGREISWIIILFIFLMISHGAYNIITSPSENVWEVMKVSLGVNLGIGVFPITIILILAKIRQLKTERILLTKAAVPVLVAEKNMEMFEDIPIVDIIFIKSLDNYSEIHYLSTTKQITKKVIRKSLLVIENNLTSKGFLRVHRSFIVNLIFVEGVEGNANKTVLKIKNSERLIPVSRIKRKEILDIFPK